VTSKIIGFTGKKQAGKGYLSNLLISEIGPAKRVSFAGPLYEYVTLVVAEDWYTLMKRLERDFQLLDVPMTKLPKAITALSRLRRDYRATQLESGKHRWLLQQVGTEVFRNTVFRDYWLELAWLSCTGDWNIIDDVRFENEARICDTVIMVLGGLEGDTHDSENQKIRAGVTIDNRDKDPEKANQAIKHLVEQLSCN